MKDHEAARHPDLLVGIGQHDDGGVYALGDGRALIQTVDIFTPVVDSPRDWGRIAAANALSDIYAMAGTPMTALQYLAWPRDALPLDLAAEVTAAGMDVMAQAACTVVGGHSIDAPEPTYGFAVTGIARVDDIVTNGGARPGDDLVLTKPLGMGIVTTAIKRGKCPPDLANEAIELMATLNDVAGLAIERHHASAATDVTGFGFLGHLIEMLDSSGVGATIDAAAVPVLDGVPDLLAQGMWAGGSQRNLEAVKDRVISELDMEDLKPLIDAQTSGGLIAALPPDETEAFLSFVRGSVRVGTITSDKDLRVA